MGGKEAKGRGVKDELRFGGRVCSAKKLRGSRRNGLLAWNERGGKDEERGERGGEGRRRRAPLGEAGRKRKRLIHTE